MFNDPYQIVAGYAIVGLAIAALWKLIAWVRESPVQPEPWDASVEKELEVATEVCPHCSTPQPVHAWFCRHCGRAVGPYNNLMPYVQIFSEGEVLRNSTQRQFRNRPLILIGYFLIGLAFFPLFLLPVYWLSLVRSWKQSGRPDGQ